MSSSATPATTFPSQQAQGSQNKSGLGVSRLFRKSRCGSAGCARSGARGVCPAPGVGPKPGSSSCGSASTAGTHLEGNTPGGLLPQESGRTGCRTELSTWSLWRLSPGFGSSWRKQQWARKGFGVSWLVSHWINPPPRATAPAARGAGCRCRGRAAPREGAAAPPRQGQVGRASFSLGFGMWPRKAVADQGWCQRQNCSEQEAGLENASPCPCAL